MGNTSSSSPNYMYQSKDWPWVWALRDPEVLDWKKALTPEEQTEVYKSQSHLDTAPLQVTDDLFIGASQSVQSADVLHQMGITHVLNTATDLAAGPVSAYQEKGIAYLQLDAEDEEDYPILERHLQQSREFVEQCRENEGGKCVIHCAAGMNRSGTILSANALLDGPDNVLEVVANLRRTRGNFAVTNEGFQEQLVALARVMDKLGPKPGTKGSIVQAMAAPEQSRHHTLSQVKKTRLLFNRLSD